MANYTKQDIYRLVEEEDVEFIRLQFVDSFGALKNIAMTANHLDRILENRVVFDGAPFRDMILKICQSLSWHRILTHLPFSRGVRKEAVWHDLSVMC